MIYLNKSYLTLSFIYDSAGKVLNIRSYNLPNRLYISCIISTVPLSGTVFLMKGEQMDNRVAIMGIIVENTDSVSRLNELLHEYGEYIIGRMGIPYKEKKINIVSVAIDAPQDVISSMSGKIGNLDGISVKTAYSNVK